MQKPQFETPTLPRLETVWLQLQDGHISIPMPNGTWNIEKKLGLLDSIYRGFPIGNLTTWRINTPKCNPEQPHQGTSEMGGNPRWYCILDGKKRAQVLLEAFSLQSKYYYTLGQPSNPSPFVYSEDRYVPTNWLPLKYLFDSEGLFEHTYAFHAPPQRKEAERLANIFRDYPVCLITVVTGDCGMAGLIATRLNT